MAKLQTSFTLQYPLKKKSVKNLRIVTETVGHLIVEGVAYCNPDESDIDIYDKYDVDIDFIKWDGTNIKPVLEVSADILVAEIEDACLRNAAKLFEAKKEDVV